MFELIKLYFDMCLLRKGPQDVPYSLFVFWLSMVLYGFSGLLLLYMRLGWLDSMIQLSVEIVLILGFTGVMLTVSGRLSRFFQTASAMLGTDAIISFLGLPVISSMMLGSMSSLPYYVSIGLMIWHLFITGHIFRHALDKSYGFGLGLAFLYIFFSFQTMVLLFAESAPAG